jgi:hypothetical protein
MAAARRPPRHRALNRTTACEVFWHRRKRTPPVIPAGAYVFIIALLLAAKALVLDAMRRPLICPCGVVRIWQGEAQAADSSQHLADWYSGSHVIFGVLLFWLMWRTSQHWPTGWLFVVAVASSVVWEVIENTPAIVAHFSETELGRHYLGDSIVNSMADSFFVVAGFALARALPVPAMVALVLVLEIAAAAAIRDSFILTTLTFFYRVPEITSWQRGP